jgi:hypothetical protein
LRGVVAPQKAPTSSGALSVFAHHDAIVITISAQVKREIRD